MFFLLALLTELGRLQAHVGSEGIFLHVTVPRKILSNDSEVSERKMIYIITIDGQPYTLHLRKQSFLPQNFLVYTYNEAGSLHSESPYFMMHCHYQGYAAEFPNSFVTLSICSGLRGFLQFENVSYGIEPLESSARFEHIIYQMKNNDPNVSILAENYSHIWQKDQSYKVPLNSQKKNLSKLLPQYLEIYIIVEKALYDYMGSEMMAVTQKIVQVIGLVNTMFTQFRLTVTLSSLELWSNENQISTSGDADDILQRFLAWKRDYLILRPHDIAYLLVYRKHPKYVGATFPGTICNESYDAGIAMECQFKKCCDYNTCKLKGSVKCGSGPCCTSKCELSIVGTPCRKSVDPECDFTEYCNGTSSDCVPDTYALNGHLCKLGTAYCYNGQCQTTDNQCAKIFGKGAQGAPFACFKEVNSLHERSENCGFKNSQPLPCERKDVLCGKLACVQPHKNAYKSDIQYTVYSYIQDHVCVSIATGSSMRSDGTDNAYVADGTMCGPEMYCVNKTCRKVHLTGYNCNTTTKCKGKGICNNFGNCQCFPGHKPPDCKFQFGSPGGSIDDGNFQKSDEFYTEKGYNAHWNNWFILSFYIVLPFFIIFTIVIFKRNEIRKLCNRENTELIHPLYQKAMMWNINIAQNFRSK
ncbi:disintegrin and metalloproteinase domain-containing protein 18 isoform X9 [Macaca fascicularis]|uniref:disintegrin and metalloproteinase domain-containing protein 18 isoform X9 n=1 Tax=Macaca fascicularis TaxID=9541 RepID=UPI0032B0570E